MFYISCPDCTGTGLFSDPEEPCVYCDGKGYREERRETDAELRARVRLHERLLWEPGFEMAFLYLLDAQIAGQRAEIERAALGKAA